MGNYSGRIRCGYCYEYGHNSRTCPEKKKRLEEQLEANKSDDNGRYAEYYANQIAKMTGVNPETGEKRTRRNESWGRKCSYCNEHGHNRRTCETLKSDLVRYAALTRTARSEVRAWALEDGIGIGAMVKYSQYGYNDAKLMMVEALNLHVTHHRARFYEVTLRPMSGVGRKETVNIQEPEIRKASAENRYAACLEAVGKLNPEQMAAQIKEDWVSEDIDWKKPSPNIRNGVFDKGESRDHYFWQEQDSKSTSDVGEIEIGR